MDCKLFPFVISQDDRQILGTVLSLFPLPVPLFEQQSRLLLDEGSGITTAKHSSEELMQTSAQNSTYKVIKNYNTKIYIITYYFSIFKLLMLHLLTILGFFA